jgi:uncharacterized protein
MAGEAYSDEFLQVVGDLLRHPLVQAMDRHLSHGATTVLEHSLAVSWRSFRLCRKLGLDAAAAARAGLLHDFYLYDWHDGHLYKGWHGFAHPGIALQNARNHFAINDVEADSIASHMWPLTWRPPRHRVAWVVCLADKGCALAETLKVKRKPR